MITELIIIVYFKYFLPELLLSVVESAVLVIDNMVGCIGQYFPQLGELLAKYSAAISLNYVDYCVQSSFVGLFLQLGQIFCEGWAACQLSNIVLSSIMQDHEIEFVITVSCILTALCPFLFPFIFLFLFLFLFQYRFLFFLFIVSPPVLLIIILNIKFVFINLFQGSANVIIKYIGLFFILLVYQYWSNLYVSVLEIPLFCTVLLFFYQAGRIYWLGQIFYFLLISIYTSDKFAFKFLQIHQFFQLLVIFNAKFISKTVKIVERQRQYPEPEQLSHFNSISISFLIQINFFPKITPAFMKLQQETTESGYIVRVVAGEEYFGFRVKGYVVFGHVPVELLADVEHVEFAAV